MYKNMTPNKAKIESLFPLVNPKNPNPSHVTNSKNKLGCLEYFHNPSLHIPYSPEDYP
jgi:hypothetical protein